MSVYVDGDDENKVLALAVLTIVRPSGDSYDTEMAYLHTMEGDRVAEMETWPYHARGLSELARPEEVSLPS
jgi:ketosteroid isomerase-like protein